MISDYWNELQSGSQADWASAFGSILAAVVAVVIAVVGATSQGRRERRSAMKAVVVYQSATSKRHEFKVWNGGPMPIFDVRSYSMIERGNGPEESASFEGQIASNDGADIELSEETTLYQKKPHRITFRDSNGQKWMKNIDGEHKKLRG